MANTATATATATDRIGSSPRNWAPVLNRPIPVGGFGRRLSRSECRALRGLGWSVNERCIVVRRFQDSGAFGLVYHPAPFGGYANAGIYVCEK